MSRILTRLGDTAGQIALQKGLITSDQWDLIQQSKDSLKGSPGEMLINMGFVKETDLYQLIAAHLRFPLFSPEKTMPDMGLMRRIPADLQKPGVLLPLKLENNKFYVAMEDPADVMLVDDLRRACGLNVVPVLAIPKDIARFVRRDAHAAEASAARPKEDEAEGLIVDEDEQASEMSATQAPAIRLMNVVLRDAIEHNSSDIHIEPGLKEVLVRYRVDGMLFDVMTINKQSMYAPLIVRIKVMAEMDIAESRKPQDGQFRIRSGKRTVDIRVSTLPTIHGEKAVLRLLDRSQAFFQFHQLGMNPKMEELVEAAAHRPYGLLLVSGPTGSGKTTTLYSVLHHTQSTQRNVITIEDPVEYVFPRVNQVQVNRKAGMTFASVMRSLLRQDPDIIMVGEIRDVETARLAVEAAMTGHLVVSTVHTNDAPGTVSRLIDMGIEPFLISASLSGILAQRLVRKVCDQCRAAIHPSPESLAAVGLASDVRGNFFRGAGCDACRHSGYRGRTGIFEFLPVNENIKELIVRRASIAEIREASLHAGMESMRDSGLEKALTGITTIEEVMRVVETPE